MRHFTMDDAQLLDYLSKLHVAKLTHPYSASVYSVPDSGRIKVHQQTLKVGTPVFEDGSGKPILLVKCGNPLTLGPHGLAAAFSAPHLKGAMASAYKPVDSNTGAPGAVPLDAVAMAPTFAPDRGTEQPSVLTNPNPTNPTNPTSPTNPTNPNNPTVGPVDVPPTRPQVFVGGHSFNPGGLLAGLGAIGGGVSIISRGSGPNHPEAVPEPVGVFALSPLLLCCLRRRRASV